MGKRLWDLAKSRIEIGTILPGHRHKVTRSACVVRVMLCVWQMAPAGDRCVLCPACVCVDLSLEPL